MAEQDFHQATAAPPQAADEPQRPATAEPSRRGPLSGPLGVLAAVLIFAIAGYLFYTQFYAADPADPEFMPRTFLCTETNQTFVYERKADEALPVMSPFSKKRTGYPAVACWWTKEGTAKSKPNFVILNKYLGKPGDTRCPECGRIITEHEDRPKIIPAPPASAPTSNPG